MESAQLMAYLYDNQQVTVQACEETIVRKQNDWRTERPGKAKYYRRDIL